jgi:hypothetical protein
MAKARTYGSGWHGQRQRHSNARRTGRAGGTYHDLTKSEKKNLSELRFKRGASAVATLGATEAIRALEPKYTKKDFTKSDLKTIKKFYSPYQRYFIFGLTEKDFKDRGV